MEGEGTMRCEIKLLNSLEKVFFDKINEFSEHTKGSMFLNESYSFQLAVWGVDECQIRETCLLKVDTEIQQCIELKSVGYVPSVVPANINRCDEDYISTQPGLFPDPLYAIQNGEIDVYNKQSRAVWITVSNVKRAGIYPITFTLCNQQDEILASTQFTLEVIGESLPPLPIYNTGWFHGDCIAKLHSVEVLSDEYFEIVKKYIDTYVKFGHNMILTPIFTPPLDTAVGGERPTNQLVGVCVNQGNYSYDFSYLKKWIDICKEYGICYFEISHLFTQWGAYSAPKIMADVDGNYQKLFGWETDALSEEYKGFLHSFLPILVDFLKQQGVMDNCFFHVSDEPEEYCEEQYRSARELLLPYVKEEQIIDALSSYSFYEKGISKRPVVSTDHIHVYMEHGAQNLWAYYCTAQGVNVSNRFMAMPSSRNRILGYQLYKYDIKGFLHWGYNFWFSQFSKKVINPYADTNAGGAFQSGDAFMVYPIDERGEVVCSLRLHVFRDAMQDVRAMKLLEKMTDKETVLELLDDIDGFTQYPRNSHYILNTRELINQKIKEMI